MRVLIVGAGIAGLACADSLVAGGHTVALVDKGRRAGGRMSTRETATEDGRPLRFDHGAQYFTARDPHFVEQVARWEADGVAARWPAAGADAWVGTPAMRDVTGLVTARHDVTWNTRIDALDRDAAGWTAAGAQGRYDTVIIAVPAEQAAPLLAPHRPDHAALAAATRSEPCWTAMAAFDDRVSIDRDVVRGAGAIGWAARDGAKPGRSSRETWVIQASPGWSRDHLEDDAGGVADALLALFAELAGMPLPPVMYLRAHRWRYARSGGRSGPGALWDPAIGLGVCGDWLADPRVEAAWLSGRALAARMADERGTERP